MAEDPGTAAADDMARVRAAIDELDTRLVGLVAERQRWVERAGEIKRGQEPDAVRAPARVEAVIARVRAVAATTGASPDVVEAMYRAMISAFIQHELTVHASGSHPADVR